MTPPVVVCPAKYDSAPGGSPPAAPNLPVVSEPEDLPQLRASDADREEAAERLRAAAGRGQLDVDELEDRLEAVYAGRTRAELERLVADVGPGLPSPQASATGVSVVPGEGGERWIVSVLGGSDRHGRWRLAERSRAINFWGGGDLDLNEVELAANTVELLVVSVMGGADIHVPDGLRVEVSQFAFLGGNDVELGAEATDPDGPTVRIRLVSVMGGSNVRRGRKRARRRLHRGHGDGHSRS